MRSWRPTLKSKKLVLKNAYCDKLVGSHLVWERLTAVVVAGRKIIVMAAMTRMTALS
jgi:hypothetical protein